MMGKTATKRKKTKAKAAPLSEVKSLREPTRSPMHCGVPMKKFSHPATLGGMNTVLVCAKDCGYREPIATTGR